MSEPISNAEYERIQGQLLLLAGFVRGLDLQGFLDRINDSEVLAPIIDPTLWIRGNKNLSYVKQLAEGALRFKAAADEIAAKGGGGDGA